MLTIRQNIFCSRQLAWWILIFGYFLATDNLYAQMEAFPSAEGFGKYTSGGRGGVVTKVTSLSDSGPGTLREALTSDVGARYVVFSTGGLITLRSNISVKHPNTTIAGQTAPGGGIAISGGRIWIRTDNVIVRGLRFRVGGGIGDIPYDQRDGISIGNFTGVKPVNDVIVDHNSFSWATDENVCIFGQKNDGSTGKGVRNVTIQNNIVAEALSPHSFGLLVGNRAHRVTIYRNLFVSNDDRNPLIKKSTNIEVINNHVCNYKSNGLKVTPESISTAHVIGNSYMAGQDTNKRNDSPVRPIFLRNTNDGTGVFLENNIGPGRTGDTQAQTDIAWFDERIDPGGKALREPFLGTKLIFVPSNVPTINATSVKDYVIGHAGARWPSVDAVDRRILAQTQTCSSRIIHSESQVGGYPLYELGDVVTDIDDDGMPDWFERRFGMIVGEKDHNADNDNDGYTNIEEYINGIISGFDIRVSGSD